MSARAFRVEQFVDERTGPHPVFQVGRGPRHVLAEVVLERRDSLDQQVEIDRRGLAFDLFDGKPAADVDIGGIFYDDNGKPKSSFVGRLRIAAPDSSGANAPALYRFQAWLPAGLYQVRVGLRDTRTGKMGSAEQWIKVQR